jgi:glycine cleavage system regulatory protein
MPTFLVLTVIGEDRPGLVETVSEMLTTYGGNWQESRMACLAGKFAGILLASVPDHNVATVIHRLQELESRGLKVVVEKSSTFSATAQSNRLLTLNLVGQDHPGIVRDISHALASHQINIEELNTECSSASWSGETLFHATIRLQIPHHVDIDTVKETLEGLANELMVDITLDEIAVSTT